MSVELATLFLAPALPVAVAVGCLPMRNRWMAMSIMRWALLGFLAIGLLLLSYDVWYGQHVLGRFGFDESTFGGVLGLAADAYVIALLMSLLSPWRRPRP
jgi:hypothetical protein